MRTLTNAEQSYINSNEIWIAKAITVEWGATTYRLTDHYIDLVIGLNTFISNGRFLNIEGLLDNTAVDANTVNLTISILEPTFRSVLLSSNPAGGKVTIQQVLIDTSTGKALASSTPINLFIGHIFSYSIGREFEAELTPGFNVSGFNVTLDVRSATYLLMRAPARKTNNTSQQSNDSTDRSMEFVPRLAGASTRIGA